MSEPAGPKIAKHSSASTEPESLAQKLQVVSARTSRGDAALKAGANLSGIFIQLVELQQQFGQQIVSLEEGIQQQRQELVNTMGQLPEIKEKINWLVASFYEQGKKDLRLREKVARNEATLLNVAKAVRSLCDAQAQWKAVMERLAETLEEARSLPVTPPPEIVTG